MSDRRTSEHVRQPIALAPRATPNRDRSILPTPLTSFVGREDDIARVGDLLHNPDVRLLTLSGPGGVGKTRLALQVAAAVSHTFADGVVFVDLTPLVDPGLVAPSIARALGVREVSGRSVADRLIDSLSDQVVLLVLDNFEQVTESGPILVELLRTCPGLKIMVTSRVRLRVSGEQTYNVPPLAVLPQEVSPSVAQVSEAAATRLFIARAKAADHTFQLTEANAGAVAQICRQVDGLPLAIELAAARIALLPPEALVAHLGQESQARLPLLSDGPRDAPARQRTLRGAIAWSYALLPEAEQALFRMLAVFANGCPLAAAEQLAIPRGQTSIDVMNGISSLVDQSLLVRMDGPSTGQATPRFGMLETIREFALEQLAAAGEEDDVRAAHAAFCMGVAQRDQRTMAWNDIAAWFDVLQAEHDNIRLALGWLERRGDVATFLRLAGNLSWFWLYRSHRVEGRRWLERALDAARHAEVATGDRAWALYGAALLIRTQHDDAQAEHLCHQALGLYRDLNDSWGIALVLNLLGSLARNRGDHVAARAFGEEALTHFERLGMERWMARVRAHLGIVAHWQGDDIAAETLLTTALTAHQGLSDRMGSAITLHWLASVKADRGDLGGAASLEIEGIAAARGAGAQEALIDGIAGLATVAAGRGQTALAVRLLGAVRANRERLGYRFERPEHERYRRVEDAARQALGENAFTAAELAGRALTIEEAVAEATQIAKGQDSIAPVSPASRPDRYGLTPREMDVLQLLAQRRTDREIAEALFISPKTAGFHVANVLGKLGVANRREAATLALRDGLVST